jgi:hypothetical protein
MRRARELREKKQTRCGVEERAEARDRWDQTALAAESTRSVSRVGGNRPHEQPQALGHAAKQRLRPRHLPAIFPDASEG